MCRPEKSLPKKVNFYGSKMLSGDGMYHGNAHPDSPCAGKSPGGGDASGGMAAHGLVKAAEKVLWIA